MVRGWILLLLPGLAAGAFGLLLASFPLPPPGAPEVRATVARPVRGQPPDRPQRAPTLAEARLPDRSRLAAILIDHGRTPGVEVDTGAVLAAANDADEKVRAAALRKLGRLELPPATLLRVFRGALDDPAPSVRVQAIAGLLALDVDPAEVVPDLLRALRDEDRAVRREATGITGLGAFLHEVIPALIERLADPEPNVRSSAAHELGDLGPAALAAAPRLALLLADGDPQVRRCATEALGLVGDSRSAAAVADLLEDDSDVVRRVAAEALGGFGPDARTAVPSLAAVLDVDGEDETVREAALTALCQIGGPDAARALVRELRRREECRWEIADRLGDLGPDAATAVPALAAALGGDDACLVESAARALARIGGERATSALLDALAAGEPDLRSAAAAALSDDDAVVRADPLALRDALHDEMDDVREGVAIALGRLGPTAAIAAPDLQDALLTDPAWEVRASAARALGRIGQVAGGSTVALTQALRDPDADVRAAVARALGESGPEAVVRALVERLSDEETEPRQAVAGALLRLGVERELALRTLRADLEASSSGPRVGAAAELLRAGAERERAEAALAEALRNGVYAERYQAAQVVAELGPAAADLAPTLEELLASTDGTLREAVAAALRSARRGE